MRVLALVDAPDHVCSRYRIRAFEPHLARAGVTLVVLGLERGFLGRFRQFSRLDRYDAIVLQRTLLPVWQLRLLRSHARRLVYDFDDAVLFRDSYDRRGLESPRRARRFAATVRAADVVIAGNDFLGDLARRAGANPSRVHRIPTCISPEQYRVKDGRDGPGLDLVWIGSSSTLQGLERRRDLWDTLAGKVPGVRLRVICDRFPDLGAMPVVAVPWSEDSEAAALADGDVGVSWVPDDAWSRGKCGLKVLQYQAAGLPVLANPVGVQAEMIAPGVNGWRPETISEWVDAVRALAEDPALRKQMGHSARAGVVARYSVDVWAPAFVAAVVGSPQPDVNDQSARGPWRRPTLADRMELGPIGAKG